MSFGCLFCLHLPIRLLSSQIYIHKCPDNLFCLLLCFCRKRKTICLYTQFFCFFLFFQQRSWQRIVDCIITELTATYTAEFFLISVFQNILYTGMITMIHRFLHTLHGNHHRCITVYSQFTVFIASVYQFFCIQLQRNRISENSFFHPERFCPVVHCINIRIQNDPGGKSHRI